MASAVVVVLFDEKFSVRADRGSAPSLHRCIGGFGSLMQSNQRCVAVHPSHVMAWIRSLPLDCRTRSFSIGVNRYVERAGMCPPR